MAFQFITKQSSGKKVTWKFENNDRIFTSEVEKFKRNVEFWQKKLFVDPTVQVELLEGAQWLQNYLSEEKEIVDVEHEIVENDELIDDSALELTSGDEPDAQPSMDESVEDTVDTPKRKSRKKTA